MTNRPILVLLHARRVLDILIAAVVVACLTPLSAHAQLTVSAGIEVFDWEEDTSPVVSEDGELLALAIGYTQKADSGFLLGYRGKLWTGTVDYNGSTLFGNIPITGSTGYIGLTNEVQARIRKPLDSVNYRRDTLIALGLDWWRRELSSIQKEDFTVLYLRAGMGIDSADSKTWLLEVGAKYPLWVREDAHLTNIGFDSNPRLSPGGRISFFGKAGYRLTHNWNFIAYIDGHRFAQSQSEPVNEVAIGLGQVSVFQPASDMLIIGFRLEHVFQ